MNKELDRECGEALAKARAIIKKKAPYICSTLYGLVPHFHPGLATIAAGPMGVTKGMVLIIDPDWYITLTPEMGAGCLMHECMHILRGIERIEALPNRDLAGIAADLPINSDLRQAGWELPDWAHYPETHGFPDGLTMEEYYDLLAKKKSESKSGKSKKDKGGGGSVGDQSQEPAGKICSGKCGGGSGGSFVDQGLEDKLDQDIGRAKADQQRIRKQTIQDIKDAAKGPGKGDLPASFQEFIDFEPKPSLVPWRQTLKRVVRRTTGRMISGRADYSLRKISKRSFFTGIIRPGMVERELQLALVRDTSGSMGNEQINAANTEIISILKQIGIDSAWLLDADAAVACAPRKIRVRDIPNLHIYGRGGTSFIPAILAAQKLRPKPDVLIYLTDGDGDAPATPPKNMEVVWCVVPSAWGRRPANWGHLVIVSDDAQLREPYGVSL